MCKYCMFLNHFLRMDFSDIGFILLAYVYNICLTFQHLKMSSVITVLYSV